MGLNAGMFDIYHTEQVTKEVTKQIHHHRAPTDESVKILKECEDSMRKKVVDSFKVEGNSLNVKWIVFDNYPHGNIDVTCAFKINGTEYKIEKQMDIAVKRAKSNRGEIIQGFVKDISDRVTMLLFMEGKFPTREVLGSGL